MTRDADAATRCITCDRPLTEDEIADPETDADGDLLCDDFYLEANHGPCARCGEWVHNPERSLVPGHVTGIWREVRGLRGRYRAPHGGGLAFWAG